MVARCPQLGHDLDLHGWKNSFFSVPDAYTSAPRAAVRQAATLLKFSRTAARTPACCQISRALIKTSLSGCLLRIRAFVGNQESMPIPQLGRSLSQHS